MNVLVTGSGGLIGSALSERLEAGGHRVARLVRSREKTTEDRFFWDPQAGTLDHAALDGADAVVHLAGETLVGRWTDEKKRRIRDSRIGSTRLLSEAIASSDVPPRAFLCASAVGYYGDRDDQVLTEQSPPGDGFLAEVVRDWEAATAPAARASTRVVNLRSGVVLSRDGGALATLLRPFRLGLGGPVAGGDHYMSWISIDDEVRAIEHAILTEELSGPVNLVAPHPVRNREFTKTLGRVLHRPVVLPTPLLGLVALFGGEFADQVIVPSTRALPARLLESGYSFEHERLEVALTHVLSR